MYHTHFWGVQSLADFLICLLPRLLLPPWTLGGTTDKRSRSLEGADSVDLFLGSFVKIVSKE